MCGSALRPCLPASLLPSHSLPPPQALVGGGARHGDWTAALCRPGSRGVQAVGWAVRAWQAPLYSKMLGPLHSNQPGFCGRVGPGWRGSAQGLAGLSSRARGPRLPETPSPRGGKLLFKGHRPQPLSSWQPGHGCWYPEVLVPTVLSPQLLRIPREGAPCTEIIVRKAAPGHPVGLDGGEHVPQRPRFLWPPSPLCSLCLTVHGSRTCTLVCRHPSRTCWGACVCV